MSWRFHPPPGWPAPPEDWVPPPGWAPDPSWPPAPPDWNFWVPAAAPAQTEPDQPASPASEAATELPTAPVQPAPAAPLPGGLGATPAAPTGHYPPPPYGGFPSPPQGKPGRGRAWAIGAGLAALLLVVCTGGVITVALHWDRLAGDGPTPTDGPVEASVGWEECAEQPDVCNSGERDPGGSMVWMVDNLPTAYFPWTFEGGTIATLQAVHGILPHFGQFLPSGGYEYNLDVLAAEPELVGEDPLQTVWRINPDAVWDDGTPISADDVIITWKMNTPDEAGYCTGCESREFDDQIESIEGSDGGKTVTVTYQPGVSNPEWFAEFSAHSVPGGIVPAHVAERNGWNPDDPADLGAYFEFLNENPPGFSGGPYLIESFDLNQQAVKVPNPNWYGEVQPTLDELVIRFGSDPLSWVPALQSGELHGGSPNGWSEDVIRRLQDLDDVLLHIQPGPVWDHLDVNMDNEWLGGDVELRQAIFTAIDAEEIAQRNFGELVPDSTLRTNHVQPSASDFHVDQLAGTGQGTGDIELARDLLAAAGYEGYQGGPGALTLDDEPVGPLRLRTTTSPQRTVAVELIAGQLAEIGIEVEIEPGDLGPMLFERDYDLVLFGWSTTPLFTGTGGQYWETDSGSNFGGYSNDEVDDLAAREREAPTMEESAALHDQMMQIVVADAYVLPLYDTPIYVFVTDEFINVRDNPNSSMRALYQHHEWGVAAG